MPLHWYEPDKYEYSLCHFWPDVLSNAPGFEPVEIFYEKKSLTEVTVFYNSGSVV